ncbi:hypothetical protein K08M3_24930 [Vibrio alginolyticus]|uniref:HNH nuclease domain-containing protein n=7 Tax=Vibrio alginolyticus TaxID=663 RepID=A0A1W6TU39_VIBAL|nr:MULTISPECIES: HNH endonuclease [Vibrio]ARO99418.1 hypothetical protein K01M1_24870 [Vibrio alginolyticus]ARP04134.1 hypothetical protein K04M1_25020 [Vibrio alginolyticus]ARP09191.1 hypothetical protein K04M3_25030 [Vibrio alginolyticus]ARP14269.1 hypothetical protein K04M5_24930 [Vibrio alginolyticus]ARP19328.1 hypothetical protein K05K4_25060 [Vibrio alginolyticus]
MSDFFIKIIGSQESGKRTEKENGGGKYALIFKPCWELFPKFTQDEVETVINPKKEIDIYLSDNIHYPVSYTYFNEKERRKARGLLPELRQNGKPKTYKNERRLTRSVSIENYLKLKEGDLLILLKISTKAFLARSIQKEHIDEIVANRLNEQCQKNGAIKQGDTKLEMLNTVVPDMLSLRSCIRMKVILDSQGGSGEKLRYKKLIDSLKKENKGKENRIVHPPLSCDPAKEIADELRTQEQFSLFIRKMYDNKCVVRGSSIIDGVATGLEAAHIMPYSCRGPFSPSNGILLSADLHCCFDKGYFTISESNRIHVSNRIPKNSYLWKYKDKEILLKWGMKEWKPYTKYIKYHRENIFDRFPV